MTIKNQKTIEFVNTCGCLVDEEKLKEAVLWYAKKPVMAKKKIFMHGKYPAVAIGKEKIHVHRLLMMYKEGRKLDYTEYVHHIDENKKNANYENLQIVYQRDHQSFHNKGKVFTEQHRERISMANRRRRGVRHRKRRVIPNEELLAMVGKGMSINSIAKHFGVDWSTIKSRLNDNLDIQEASNG
ncbi:HNH endonuclease [Paenibacillus vini]|uniref:HNH nuclease domain-containing protein n=1 Tax=Paenibacillus vini TaxID=1476024 RepID=A0ABQ4MIW6_9BACL|nr:HNH endonuclease [Paenibacillus vini]GIP55934.1 hypothetical protein J42TS3_49690 [Paenibacillus vini]